MIFIDFFKNNLIIAFEDGRVMCCNSSTETFSLNHSLISGCFHQEIVLLLLTSQSTIIIFDINNGSISAILDEPDLGSHEHNGFIAIYSRQAGHEIILSGRNRVLRVITVNLSTYQVQLKFKLQDAVDRYSWKGSGFSHHVNFDASFTFAAVATKGKHLIYIWENSTSNLVQKLEGPKEEVAQLLWSPIKPKLYSIGSLSGKIYILGPQFPQKWAALVPNIEALETNIEYIEREDEFDLSVEDEIAKNRQNDESIELDLDSFKTPTVPVTSCSTVLFPL